MNILPGYLVFRQGNVCSIEPYMLSRFARQFGYDQLYFGNPNTGLLFSGNLYEKGPILVLLRGEIHWCYLQFVSENFKLLCHPQLLHMVCYSGLSA